MLTPFATLCVLLLTSSWREKEEVDMITLELFFTNALLSKHNNQLGSSLSNKFMHNKNNHHLNDGVFIKNDEKVIVIPTEVLERKVKKGNYLTNGGFTFF